MKTRLLAALLSGSILGAGITYLMMQDGGSSSKSAKTDVRSESSGESFGSDVLLPSELIGKLKRALETIESNSDEFHTLSRKRENGVPPLSKTDEERLHQLRSEHAAFHELTYQVVRKLKVGNSVFSYPGLLTLSEISLNEQSNTYSFGFLAGYDSYEGGPSWHPRTLTVRFDGRGLITGIDEFRSVKMVTE